MIVTTFDTETTGLLHNPMSRVIEFGMVKHDIETGEIIDTDQYLVIPDPKIIPHSDFNIPLQFCGITKEEIMDTGIPYQEALHRFCGFVGRDLVWAWNLPFDMKMLLRYVEDAVYYQDNKAGAFEWTQKIRWGGCWQHLYAFANVSTGRTERFDDGNLKTISMAKTMKYEGWDGEQPHRALEDALLAARIGQKIFTQLNK